MLMKLEKYKLVLIEQIGVRMQAKKDSSINQITFNLALFFVTLRRRLVLYNFG